MNDEVKRDATSGWAVLGWYVCVAATVLFALGRCPWAFAPLMYAGFATGFAYGGGMFARKPPSFDERALRILSVVYLCLALVLAIMLFCREDMRR